MAPTPREVPCHLIAHSHGGSVVLEALRQSLSGPPGSVALKHLVTWTTVGTPFVVAEGARRRVAVGLLRFFAVALVVVGWLLWVTVPKLRAGVGYWTWLTLAQVGAVQVFLVVALAPVLDAWEDSKEERRLLDVADEYGRKWIGIYWLSTFVYNVVLRRPVARFVGRRMAGAAIGDDRPEDVRWVVRPAPVGCASPGSLAENIEAEILELADARSAEVLRDLRRRLVAATGRLQGALPFDEPGLVHTSYFGSPLVKQRIAEGIRAGQSQYEGAS